MRIHALLLELLRHLSSYRELGTAAAQEYRSAWARRAVLALLAAASGVTGFVALWMAGLIELWATAWRLAYVMSSASLLLVVAAAALYAALRRPVDGHIARTLRSELHKDLELFEQWKSTL